MKYTLRVLQGLCAVAADIIKLAWWMAAMYATKYFVCTVWNLSALWNTAALAVNTLSLAVWLADRQTDKVASNCFKLKKGSLSVEPANY